MSEIDSFDSTWENKRCPKCYQTKGDLQNYKKIKSNDLDFSWTTLSFIMHYNCIICLREYLLIFNDDYSSLFLKVDIRGSLIIGIRRNSFLCVQALLSVCPPEFDLEDIFYAAGSYNRNNPKMFKMVLGYCHDIDFTWLLTQILLFYTEW